MADRLFTRPSVSPCRFARGSGVIAANEARVRALKMALTQRLDLRQSQSLVMTPQLQQAIKLLQLSNLELCDYVDRELEQNPLLERMDGESPAPTVEVGGIDAPPEDKTGPVADRDGPDSRDSAEALGGGGIAGDDDLPLDTDYADIYTDSSPADLADGASDGPSLPGWRDQAGNRDFSENGSSALDSASERPVLRTHLETQVSLEIADGPDRLIAMALIDSLDDNGYLAASVDEIADALGAPAERVEAVLARVQQFDPAGLFARSLKECLALQLADLDRLDPAMQTLIDNLELLGRRAHEDLRGLCGVDDADFTDMLAELRALNPRPASGFESDQTQTVVPDIFLRAQSEGGWLVELNPDTLPRLLIDQSYYRRITSAARGKDERDYIAEQYNAANWLVKSLHQRATTILKVATEIVRQQDGFFRHGVAHLKPLILRDIAEAIGMHESTVSRVTTNKYMATNRGTYELKYFFSSSIAGANGQAAHSAEAVRFRIKALIDKEDAGKILSDDRIVEILRADGVDIARRTVAKYREALGIPSSVQRRREKSQR